MGIAIQTPGALGSIAEQVSLAAYNSTTSPGAGATLANIATPPAGVYSITAYTDLTGTVSATDQDNIQLAIDGVAQITLMVPAVVEGAAISPPFTFQYKTNGTSISLKANSAGTVSSVYRTLLSATRVA